MNSINTLSYSILNACRRTFSVLGSNFLTSRVLAVGPMQQNPRTFSSLYNFTKPLKSNALNLSPVQFTVIPSCGMKVRGKLELRCKHCYFVRLDGRMMVHCTSYPRHKQMAKVKKEKYTWILTSCSQSKKRPY